MINRNQLTSFLFFIAVIHESKTYYKTPTPDHVKAALRKALRVEVKLYELAKKRFYFQLEELKRLKRIE